MRATYLSVFSACVSLFSTLVAAQPAATLAEPAARISDSVIHQDYQAYGGLQERIHQLNERGVPVRDYRLSKAQCWLDVSLHEYTRNDRSDFPQAAITESEKLIISLEQGNPVVPLDTPLINGAARLRPDLWARTAAFHQMLGAQCGWPQIACAEVELVHAGNEFNQQGWRHAKPYIQIAEDLLADGSAAMAHCTAAMAAPDPVAPGTRAVAPPAVPAVPASAGEPLAVALTVQLLFDFDQSSADHIRPSGMEKLRTMVARVRSENLRISHLTLVGYADRLNGTGHADYNLQLSRKRVDTVRALLQAQGLAVSEARTDARGDRDPQVPCQLQFTRRAELQECLLPNRRVEVELLGVRPAEGH